MKKAILAMTQLPIIGNIVVLVMCHNNKLIRRVL